MNRLNGSKSDLIKSISEVYNQKCTQVKVEKLLLFKWTQVLNIKKVTRNYIVMFSCEYYSSKSFGRWYLLLKQLHWFDSRQHLALDI